MIKKNDITFIAVLLIIFVPLIAWDKSFNAYIQFNRGHGLITSFIKFGILATIGEIAGLRIRTGKYFKKGFGILPKIMVWGFIGITIKMAFVIFATGTPLFLDYLGINNASSAIKGDLSYTKVVVAFAISTALNIVYAPVMMTFHKITDIHITQNRGKLKSLLIPIKFGDLLKQIDWDVQWHFIFKRTIPLFWIPAQTVTFLLAPDFQVLFAALLSIVLGLILAAASLKSGK